MNIIDITLSHSELIPHYLPTARDLKHRPALYAAVSVEKPENILGLAILSAPQGTGNGYFLADVHIIEACSDNNIAVALLTYITEIAKNLSAPGIQMLDSVLASSDYSTFEHCGFSCVRKTINYRFDIKNALALIDKTMRVIEQAKRIPKNAQLMAYTKGAKALDDLCHKEFGLLTHGHLKAMSMYSTEDKDYSFSRCCLLDGQLVAGMGVGINKGVAYIDPLLVSSGQRNSWAFSYIIYHVLSKLVTNNVTLIDALVHEDNQKMMRLMQKFSATKVDAELFFVKHLSRPD